MSGRFWNILLTCVFGLITSGVGCFYAVILGEKPTYMELYIALLEGLILFELIKLNSTNQ